MHDIDTGSTRPIRCNPRKLLPKKIKIQQELVDKMLEEGQIEHSVSAWSAPMVLVTKKDPAQQKYCTTRRELLAVVATLDHFKGYVWGPKFLVGTDHAALVWLTNLKNIQGMLARWLAKLQQFHFDIEHRPGSQHGNADGLSRCPQCERGLCTPTTKTHQTDPDQPYANSCGGSSMDSELIPLESGETCVAAII